MQVRIARKSPVATDICAFELVHADGGRLPAFTAGAHVDVRLRDGLIRQYSLCNNPLRIDSSVLLPQPDGPAISVNSPGMMLTDKRLSTGTRTSPDR